MNVVIVVPTYNEVDNIEKLIESLNQAAQSFSHHSTKILVVDDNSPDKTGVKVKELQNKFKNLFLLSGEKKGLGQAYLRGMDYAVDKLKADVLFEIDADFQHDPLATPLFIEQIDKGKDFVIGSRYISGGSIPKNWGLWRKFQSRVGNLIVRTILVNFKIHDWTSGYRAIKSEIFLMVRDQLRSFNGYTFQVAFLKKAIDQKAAIVEVPITFGERKYGKSKIGGEYIKNLLIFLFLTQIKAHQRFLKFGIVGFLGFIVNFTFLRIFRSMGMSEILVWLLSTELAIINNYTLNNLWTFNQQRIAGLYKTIYKFIQFNFTSAGALAIQSIFGPLGVKLIGVQYDWLVLVFVICFMVLPYNYFMYNRVVWQTHKTKK
jgi:dolichol-phosphate mannosyltransferase